MSAGTLPPSVYQQVISDLHRHLHEEGRFPRGDQTVVIREFFQNGRMIIMAQCGRDAGKTECNILYPAWRFALTRPGSDVWIITPEKLQGKKIYWGGKNRLARYGPAKYHALDGVLKSELRLIIQIPGFHPSSITVDGCENYDALRGIKPDLVLYDERQLHTPHFDEDVMQPNLSRGTAALISVGTPPRRYKEDYIEFRERVMRKVTEGDKKYFYIELPTWANPLSDKKWLAEKKADLIRRGRESTWLREYEGKMVFDVESAILPYWSGARHLRPREWIRERLKKDISKFNWYAIFDPGTTTCFAVLFIAVNPFTSEVFILDEIYETRRGETSALKIWERAEQIKKSWNPFTLEWMNIYDSAGAWFANEVLNELSRTRAGVSGLALVPCDKQGLARPDEGRAGESVLNSLMQTYEPQLFFVCEDCAAFQREIESYVTDEMGRYPRDFDHLMDDLFYWVVTSRFALQPSRDWEEEEERERLMEEGQVRRAESFEDLVAKQRNKSDWSESMSDDIYDYEEGKWAH